MHHLTVMRAVKAAVLVLLTFAFGIAVPLAHAVTYEQTTDNENNARTGVADDDIFQYLNNDSPNAPIEFNIVVTGDLPRVSAVLEITGYDIDPSDITALSLNGVALGSLTTGPSDDWAYTTVELPLSLIRQGNNIVEVTFDTTDIVKVSRGALLIDEDAPAFDAGASIITAEDDTLLADGVSTTLVTLQTFDWAGEPYTTGGATVTLSTSLGTLSGVTDNDDGSYTATLTSATTAGIALISGTVDGVAVVDTEEVEFVTETGPVIDPASSLITAADDSLPANGTANTLITLTTYDVGGNQLTTGGAVVELVTTLGTLGSVTDNNDGTYTAQLTSAITAGVAVVTGKVNNIDVIDTAEVEFVAATGPVIDAVNSLITAADDSLPANGTSNTLITLTTFDTAGEQLTVGGAIVTLTTTLGTLGPVTDNGDGTYTAPLTSATTEGTAVVTGTVNEIDVTDTAEISFVAPAGPVIDAGSSLITAADDSIVADGSSTTLITLVTYDTAGDQLTTGGAVVTLVTTLGTLGAVTDNGDGTYTATLTSSTTEGTAVVSGTVNDIDVVDTAEVQFIASTDPVDNGGNLETAIRGGGSGGVILLSLLSALAVVRRKRLGKPLAAALGAVPFALATLPVAAVDYQLCSDKADFGIQLPSCWYVGAGAGVSRLDPDDDAGGWRVEDKNDRALKGTIGYHVLPHFFLEASYADLGDAVVESRNPAVTESEDVHYKTPSGWIGFLLLDPSSKWNLYAKAGLAKLDTDAPSIVNHDQEHNWQAAFSAGVQYRFSRRWFARLEVDSYDKDARAAFLTVNRYFGEDKKPREPAAPADVQPAPVAIVAPPLPPSPPPCKKFTGVLDGVHFATAKSDLNSDGKKSLDSVAGSLHEFKKMNVEIAAHTDSRGTDAYNMGLSQRRADSVVGYLNNKGGIASERMQAKSYGESRPIADNTTVEGMAKNRRVEIKPTNVDECVPQ